MNVLDNRRIFKDLGQKIIAREPLLDDEMLLMARALIQIGDGIDANEAFGVKYGRGKKLADEKGRQRLSAALHMVSALVDEGMEVDPACNHVSAALQANSYKSGASWPIYDARYLYNCWFENAHMRKLDRIIYDPDFPYGN